MRQRSVLKAGVKQLAAGWPLRGASCFCIRQTRYSRLALFSHRSIFVYNARRVCPRSTTCNFSWHCCRAGKPAKWLPPHICSPSMYNGQNLLSHPQWARSFIRLCRSASNCDRVECDACVNRTACTQKINGKHESAKKDVSCAVAFNQGRTHSQPSDPISRSPASNQAHNLPMLVYFRLKSLRSDQSASYCYLFSLIAHQKNFRLWWKYLLPQICRQDVLRLKSVEFTAVDFIF